MTKTLNSRIPEGPVAEKWTNYKAHQRLVNPKNKLKLDVIVVGTGLAGASAAASLGEMGFNVLNFCIQDSPRRAHSIAAQGGINAAKNYQNDGDSIYRLFYDTVKGGDYRARESNVYRLAEVSNDIIDQCVAQGVPFAREYGGMLANRSFGGAQVSRTFYAKGQTGQQLLLGAYSSLSLQIQAGKVKLYTRYEMEDVVIVDEHVVEYHCFLMVSYCVASSYSEYLVKSSNTSGKCNYYVAFGEHQFLSVAKIVTCNVHVNRVAYLAALFNYLRNHSNCHSSSVVNAFANIFHKSAVTSSENDGMTVFCYPCS